MRAGTDRGYFTFPVAIAVAVAFVAVSIVCASPARAVPPSDHDHAAATTNRTGARGHNAAGLDAGENPAIEALAPEPTLGVMRMAACQCPPETDPNPVAWALAGLAVLGMVLTASWAALLQQRVKVIREELSRIRISRTAAIRVTQPLAAGDPILAPGQPKMPGPKGAPLPSAPGPGSSAVRPDAAKLRKQAEASLAAAQSGLDPLLDAVRATEEYFRSSDFESLLASSGALRPFLDRHQRRAVAVAATFHVLREARIFPESEEGIAGEVERYWDQVYACIDDLYGLIEGIVGEDGRRALANSPGAAQLRAQCDRVLVAAREYLATDGRRLVQIELNRTDVDPRLHRVVEKKASAGVVSGKIIDVKHCGITRDGKVVRAPEVVQSA